MKKFLKKLVVPFVLCSSLLFSTNVYAAKKVEFLSVYSNGVHFKLEKEKDVKNISGSSYIKADKLFEILNTDGTYSFDQKNDTVNYKNGNKSFSIKVGAKEAKINESPSIAPEIKKIDNVIYVPLRFVADKLGNSVVWNDEANAIGIADRKNTKEIVSMMEIFNKDFVKNPKLYMEFDINMDIIAEAATPEENISMSIGAKGDFLIDLNKKFLHFNTKTTLPAMMLEAGVENTQNNKFELYDDGTNSYFISDGNVLKNESFMSNITAENMNELFKYASNSKNLSIYDEFMPFVKITRKDGLVKMEGNIYMDLDKAMQQYGEIFSQNGLDSALEDMDIRFSEPYYFTMVFNQTTGQLLSYDFKFALELNENDIVANLKYNFKIPTIKINPDMETKVPTEIKNAAKSFEDCLPIK